MDLRLDIASVKQGLDELALQSKWAAVSVVKYVGWAMKKWITKRIGNTLGGKRSGGALTGPMGGKLKQGDTGKGLFGSIYFKRRPLGGVVTTALGYYGEPLEKGWTVHAKGDGWLTFRGSDGEWKRAKSVQLPATHWFTRAHDGFEGSSEMAKAIDKPLELAIKRAGMQP